MNQLSFDQTNREQTRDYLHARLKGLHPEVEIEAKIDQVFNINKLKLKKNALVLGHNYMEPALFHGVADFTGDSLQLCQVAEKSEKPILVYLGVEFMAESAKILNPERKVLIPSQKAGCSLASSITAEDVRNLKKRYPGVPVVTYINSYADVKAETDICCTSSNAAKIVAALDTDTVIFIPDEFLAQNVAAETGTKLMVPKKDLSDAQDPQVGVKTFVGWKGRCEVHEEFTVADIERVRKQEPDVVVLAHPECSLEVCQAADFSGSTSAIIRYVEERPEAAKYLILTECAMGDNIIAAINGKKKDAGKPADSPGPEVLRLCSVRCPHMAQITLADTMAAIEQEQYEVTVPEEIRIKAKASIDRMLEMSAKLGL